MAGPFDGPLVKKCRGLPLKEVESLLFDSIDSLKDNWPDVADLLLSMPGMGYEDEPDLDEEGKPVLRRTTPIHLVARGDLCTDDIRVFFALFTIYNRWDLNYIDEFGLTHFHVACKLGYVDVVRKFLDLGQDPNLLVRGTNDSPLILALVRYNMEVVKLLLRRGADQNLPNKNGLTPLHLTCQTDEDAASYWPQHFIRINDELNQLVQVNAQDKFGNTPLHFAVHHGKREKVEFLLRRGANVNLVNAEGSTALHIACHRGYDDATMELLFKINKQLDRPVRVNVADNWGRTPLQLAVAKISPSNLDILVNNGADVSSFVFPTDSYFGKGLKPSGNGIWFNFKLRLASGALLVVERLERAGYELDRSDALAIMKLFAEHGLFEKAADLEKHWYYDYPHFETQAREMTIAPGLSLHDLVSLSPEEAKKRIAREDYFKLARSVEVRFIPSTGWNNGPESRDAFLVHLCEKLSTDFFQSWAMDLFMKLIHYRLPVECGRMIIQQLNNEDLYNICVAATGQSS